MNMLIHLVRVTADDRTIQLWAAATSRDEAIQRVLDAIPEGWAARLLDEAFTANQRLVEGMKPGDVRALPAE
jgi:hypothetical protein